MTESPASPDMYNESPQSPKESPESPDMSNECPDGPDMLNESTEIPKESPESPDISNGCPNGPDMLIGSTETPKESPDSPDMSDEIFFVEDRAPNYNISPASRLSSKKAMPQVPQRRDDFIRLDSVDDQVEEHDGPESKSAVSHQDITGANTPQPAEDMLFVVEDRSPYLTGQETQSPRYRISENFLKIQDPKASQKKNRLANTCWNCDETTHALRDCPQPRNQFKISKARKQFQESRGTPVVYKRYHVEEGQQYGHLVPGQMSEELRRALGLDARELPPHIYMMRRLGYPPGWLLEAKVSHSGITMFDGHGQEVANPRSDAKEVSGDGSLDKYDVQKIIHYPGFNVPPPPDTYDDSKYWGCPPLSRMQSVEAMLQKLEGQLVGGYKRKKLTHSATSSADLDDTTQSAESLDMEYEETPEGAELPEDSCKFVPPLPDDDLPPPPPLELPKEPTESDTDTQSLLSTSIDENSLIELEEQKKLLLAQLNDVSPLCSTPQSRVGKVKSLDLGTPILQSVSPYARLPSADKFSVNICDVINFENLPDSTGKYKKMSGLIKKVRCKLSEINNEL